MEALSFLSQGDAVRMGWRLAAIHGSMCTFWGHPCPQILGDGQKAKDFWLFSEATATGKRFCIWLELWEERIFIKNSMQIKYGFNI